jgi:pimeloyl-ACP methyl ester carboxylesterase
MPILSVPGLGAIGYDDTRGRGPVIALIHGSPGTSRAWQAVGERLAAGFRVVAPNLPGYDTTPRPAADPAGDSSYAARLIEALIEEVGEPAVLAGHSYGGVVALMSALRGRIKPRALALFEPVAVPVLAAVGDGEGFAASRALFEGYCAAFDGGDHEAARIMVDYWFGAGAFARMPPPVREFLVGHTAQNVRDVRATFRDAYPPAALRALPMPVLCAYGSRSPAVMVRIVEAITGLVPRGIIKTIENANHAMTTTHAPAVTALITELAEERA